MAPLPHHVFRDESPHQNVRIVKLFIEIDDIPLQQDDTGGSYSRIIIMDVRSGTVYMRKNTSMGDFQEPLVFASSPLPAAQTLK